MKLYIVLLLLGVISQTTAQDQDNLAFMNSALTYQYEKLKLLMNPSILYEKLGEVYDTFTQNENYKRRVRE